jgi:hypothetical protein
MTDEESVRWWQKVMPTDGCWHWTGTVGSNGYGRMAIRDRRGVQLSYCAHRIGYEHLVGPVPDGYELDHTCENPLCVNPAHLEPVSHKTNVLRGNSPHAKNAAKTMCHNGHELSGYNLVIRWEPTTKGAARKCRTCEAANAKRWRNKHKEVEICTV